MRVEGIDKRSCGFTICAALLMLAFLSLSACGDESATTKGSIIHPTGKNELVLQIVEEGGFVPVEYNLTVLPQFSLYGDGTVIVSGPIPAIYPGPALPNLQTAVIPKTSVQTALYAAREAGLFDPMYDYGRPSITDVGTTTFVINAEGTTYRSNIYALGMESNAGGLSLEQQQIRAALNDFRSRLIQLADLHTGEIKWRSYEYSSLAVYSQIVNVETATDAPDVQPNRLDWPLGDLSTLGEELEAPQGFRRAAITGQDLDELRPLLGQATAITLWKSGGREYHLYFRPLLPDEIS